MIVSPPDLYQAFKRVWDLNGTLTALVPGGLWEGPVPHKAASGADVATPYASLQVAEGEQQYTSGRLYTQPFECRVRVWSVQGPYDTRALRRAVELTYPRETKGGLLLAGALVLGLKPLPGSLEDDPAMKEARDVVVTAVAYEVLVQAERE